MSTLADRVKETFTTTGDGDLTLGNPVANHQSIYEAQGLNDPIEYFWQDDDNEEWESGVGQHTTTTNFQRTTIKSNSSGTTDPLVIGSGTKSIICSRSAVTIAELFDQSVASGASPNYTIANLTVDNTSLVVAATTSLQTNLEKLDAAVLRARGTGVSASYTFTATAGGTTFTVGAVTGEINALAGYADGTYAGASGIELGDLTAPSTYVYLNSSFALQQQITTPTELDWDTKIFLARIAVDTDTNLIIGKEFLCNPIGHYGTTIRTLWKYLVASGVPFKLGLEITGHAADMGFDRAAGTLMEYGGTGNIHAAHELEFDLLEDASFIIVYRESLGAIVTALPKVWDNVVTDTITDLASTACVAHRLYMFSNGTLALAPGQATYANIVLTKAGAKLEEFVLNPRLKNAEFLGWWLIEETATGTSGTVDAEFVEYVIGIQGGSSSGLAGAVLRSNNGSDFENIPSTRTNLGLQIGVDVQGFSTNLDNIDQGLATTDSPAFAGGGFTGNVLIGQTVGNVFNQSSVAGLKLDGSFANIQTARNGVSLLINRITTDGTAAEFYKDGSAVGSIGVFSGNLNVLGSGGLGLSIDSSGNILPGTTETQDLGSAALEFDNSFQQNASTISDERRKNISGTIDNASAFLRLIDPVWFKYTDKVIPAETKKVERQATVTKQRKETTIEIINGKPVQVVKTVDYEENKFTNEPVLDEAGNAVMVEKVPLTHKMPVMETVTETVAEKIISHSRPHTGFPAQQIKAAMTAAGYADWAGYAYDEGEDLHMLRLTEMIAFAVKGWQESDKRLAELESLLR